MSNLESEFGSDLVAQAEKELKEEFEREEVERIKAILRSRTARWERMVRVWSLLRAAFYELIGKSTN